MRRILFASVLKACEVRKEPGLGYSSNLGLTIQSTEGKQGLVWAESTSCDSVTMLDLARGSFMGPLTGVGTCLPSGSVLGQRKSTRLGQPCSELDLGSFILQLLHLPYPSPLTNSW